MSIVDLQWLPHQHPFQKTGTDESCQLLLPRPGNNDAVAFKRDDNTHLAIIELIIEVKHPFCFISYSAVRNICFLCC